MRSSSDPQRNQQRPKLLNSPLVKSHSFSTAHQFHRRTANTTPIAKPSHKPPSTFHSFRGDIKSQDVFVEQLRKRSTDLRILFPGADKFEMLRMDVWNHDIICTPSLIVQPVSNKEVSDCLKGYVAGVHKCLTANRKYGTTLAIPRLCVAGGRNSWNCMKDGSVVLDLSKMRNVKVDPKSRSCKVSGGARIMDVDSVLGEYGLMAVLGTHAHLGVVGCVLAGGVGYASRKYGLACDNVLEAEVVLADGRLKRCSPTQHTDLFYAILGGGGGFAVVISLTLKCYPLRHAALLTFDLPSVDIRDKRKIIRNWANWMMGEVDNQGLEGEHVLQQRSGCPNEVYSQLLIPSDSSPVQFLGSSVDTDAICQQDGYLDQYRKSLKKSMKRSMFKSFKTTSSDSDNSGWADVPGLSDLLVEKFGATSRQQVKFDLIRYSEGLQAHSNTYFTPGNMFSSFKYVKTLSNRVLEILVQASCSEISPKNESKIVIMSLGGKIAEFNDLNTSVCSRDMNYMVYIEGRWDAGSSARVEKEKNKVIGWVRWIVLQLHLCDGVMSTTHPESNRDQVSKSGKSKPPNGFYNCTPETGKRLLSVKNKRDPRNVFSLASRVSFLQHSDNIDDSDVCTIASDLKRADIVKEGEIDPTDCLVPQKSVGRLSASIDESVDDDDDDDDETSHIIQSKRTEDSNVDDNISADVQALLSLTESDADLRDWSLAPAVLTRKSFDSTSPTTSAHKF